MRSPHAVEARSIPMSSKKTGPNDDLHYDSWLRALGKRLAAHRKRMGITQAKAADTCGIDVKFYQDLEYGRRPCSTRTLFGVTSSLGIGIDEAVPTKAECDAALAELQDRRLRAQGVAPAMPAVVTPAATPFTNHQPVGSVSQPAASALQASGASSFGGPGLSVAERSIPTSERHAVLGT
jgi:transcriptional regulator with XRE-family HTH domain